jgi:hypothetical protein
MRRIFGASAALLSCALSSATYAQIQPAQQRPQADARQNLRLIATPSTLRLSNAPIAVQRHGSNMIVGGWAPSSNLVVGVGLFAVPKSATANAQEARVNPMKDPTGKTTKVAAVGVSFAF